MQKQYATNPFVWGLSKLIQSVNARHCCCMFYNLQLSKMTTDQQKLIPHSILNSIYIIFKCTVASFLVCCCAAWAAGTYSSKKKMSQREQGRGSTVCVRAQEGSVKSLWQSSIRLTCLPPETTAIKPVVGCCFLPWSTGPQIWLQREKWTAVCLREMGVTGLVRPFSRDSTLILKERTFHLRECVFRHNNITNSISKLIKKINK